MEFLSILGDILYFLIEGGTLIHDINTDGKKTDGKK